MRYKSYQFLEKNTEFWKFWKAVKCWKSWQTNDEYETATRKRKRDVLGDSNTFIFVSLLFFNVVHYQYTNMVKACAVLTLNIFSVKLKSLDGMYGLEKVTF